MTENENQTSIIAGMDIQEDVLKLRIENNKLLDVINNQDVKIADLEKKVKYYEQQLSAMEKGVCDVCKVKDADYYEKQIADLEKQLEVAKDLIHQFLIQNPISDWLPKKAERFLKETDNDRKAD